MRSASSSSSSSPGGSPSSSRWPFGIKPIENPEPGHAPGAPQKPRLWRKAAIATVAGCVITGAIVGVVDAGWLSLETFAE